MKDKTVILLQFGNFKKDNEQKNNDFIYKIVFTKKYYLQKFHKIIRIILIKKWLISNP